MSGCLILLCQNSFVRQSDARWCERTAANHRLLLDWGIELEGDNDMPPSNCSIGADAPASAAFGKTAFADFAQARRKMRVLLILVDGM